jgi:hypothetical protein
MAKVRALTNRSRHLTLEALLRQLNPVLRGSPGPGSLLHDVA